MERVDYESVIIQDLLSFHQKGELNITPWYQRRSVWKRPQKAYLINTIHEHKPVPSIYIRHSIDLETERSIKEVVDGQQRVRCLIDYRAGVFAAKHPNHKRAVRYDDLTKPERSRFLLTALSVGYLVGADDQDVIEIFARINSVAKTLNPQEKRNALFSGEFKQFCLTEAVDRLPIWRRYSIFTDNDIARMVEVQWVSDLVMNLVEGLSDFSGPRLTKYYGKFDEEFPPAEAVKERLERLFTLFLDLNDDMIKGSIFARPQILFSLFLVLDSMQHKLPPRPVIESCIVDLDSRVTAMRDGEIPDALPTDVFVAFTTGNLHRIRFRRVRDREIRQRLTAGHAS